MTGIAMSFVFAVFWESLSFFPIIIARLSQRIVVTPTGFISAHTAIRFTAINHALAKRVAFFAGYRIVGIGYAFYSPESLSFHSRPKPLT